MSFPPLGVWNVRGFNSPEKVISCKRLIKAFKLDLLCLLETRVHASSLCNPFFDLSHSLFPNESCHHNFNLASSGRIWVKWNANNLNFIPNMVTSQLISGLVTVGNSPPFQISFVYASNNALERKDLWNSISLAAPSCGIPWFVAGDFNCCRFASEKSGGTVLHHSNLVDINKMIFDNKLMDSHSVGSFFTWFNQQATNPIFIKLDRGLVNEDWMKVFPNAYCSFQSPSCSDHSPIILHPGLDSPSNHRFLFKNFWTKEDKFWVHLLNAFSKPISGNSLSHFCNSLKVLKGDIKQENWANSNFITTQLDSLNSKQRDILALIDRTPMDPSLAISLKEINYKISEASSSHASWIIQRAKAKWLHHGEDDLKFLYGKIRSRVGSSKSVVNLFSCNPNVSRGEVIHSITTYFQELYNPSPSSFSNLDAFPIGNIVTDLQSNLLISPILEDEIKKAIFKGSSNSSPGPDGFNYHFYKATWHIIGPQLCNAIRFFFLKGYLPNGIKATALAIIPKHRNASTISEYRPISLCNTLYKIMAKIIASRLISIMPSIVKNTQAGFIKSRISTDSILLANDLLSLVNKRGAGNIFCAKIDIRKAFDSVSRDFLLARLTQKGFPLVFISWIKACISNVNFSVVIDGALEGFFPSSAGLRQGCPLSPYLFCIVMDAFSNMLDASGFKGFSADNFQISHLLYADDVLIFGEASVENCTILANTLKEFAAASGLFINYDKSSVMFTKNQRNKESLCQALSIFNTTNKISYLGIPISFNRLKVEDFLPLMDKLHNKFTGWKANLLSLAGRLQYLKFTIHNTIAYWIRGSIIPKTVFKFFKKTCSRFLFFGDIDSSHKLHMISWDTVTKPKCKGGLGIPSLNALQFAFNCSVIYRMYNCPSPLSSWLSAHYSSPWRPTRPKDSKFWVSVCNTAAVVKQKFKFNITPNSPISFTWDHWCNDSTISEAFPGLSLDNFNHSLLSNFICSGRWVFSDAVPTILQSAVSRIPIGIEAGNCLLWNGCDKVYFKDFIEEYYSNMVDCSWYNLVWHKKFILKHSVYVWLALVGGLKTQDALRARNIIVPSICSLCNANFETVNHLFFECSFSFNILKSIIPATANFLLRPTILQVLYWLDSGAVSGAPLMTKNLYLMMVCCTIYHLWRERNSRRFGDDSHSASTLLVNIKRIIFSKVARWKNADVLLGHFGC
ncbi:Putative ribonuclease H protein [Dendrobium catenatum]|uniref:Ribonuclease H protein n=1 Tax=Dendrobium catenatum TaxID=906689 RepID=A0A2I0V6U7_9ASPA|nr:Putative ribonuclease H protein [Dendrobium catenatum]